MGVRTTAIKKAVSRASKPFGSTAVGKKNVKRAIKKSTNSKSFVSKAKSKVATAMAGKLIDGAKTAGNRKRKTKAQLKSATKSAKSMVTKAGKSVTKTKNTASNKITKYKIDKKVTNLMAKDKKTVTDFKKSGSLSGLRKAVLAKKRLNQSK